METLTIKSPADLGEGSSDAWDGDSLIREFDLGQELVVFCLVSVF